jgi:hypothetical protein
MVQGLEIVMPLYWMYALDAFPEPAQIITIEVSFHGLSWWNKFLIHDAFSVKKQINIDLTLFQTCAFLGWGEFGVFH